MKKRAIVTGASRGIGKAIAERLEESDWQVVNLDKEPPSDGSSAAGRWMGVDLRDVTALETVLSDILAEGTATGLVNNAAILTPTSLEETAVEDFDNTVAVNLRAAMLCARSVVSGMREAGFGRIVNISSRAHLGKTLRTSYAATKGGILSLSQVWALELAGDGITVNTIAPGNIRTEQFKRINPPEMARTRQIIDAIPVGRLGEPEDVANAVAFFMDERNSFVTGQVLYVCGGVTLSRGGS